MQIIYLRFRDSNKNLKSFYKRFARKKFLTHSKDTAYLEQYILSEKLREAGLEKLLFFGAGNLQDIITLLKLSLLDISQMQIPKYHVLKIWEKEKDKYLLANRG
ncbi:MAG: hypothetical protein COS72_01825 [Candidatus Moranbacteria bacterium CG06_land_8_20_14_3_00_43_56]|nr:MAG: hypothetical protein COS72_01825 [Candidatus Moranbacteria bacterium CG06_land_8_20_14_3_00_43_56]